MAGKEGVGAFGQPFKAAMDRAGVTQAAIARSLDVRQQQISKWINGQTLPRGRATDLARILAVDEIEVMGWLNAGEMERAEAGRHEAKKARRREDDAHDRANQVLGIVERFVDQYQNLGHTYQRLDQRVDDVSTRLTRVEQLLEELTALLRQQRGR